MDTKVRAHRILAALTNYQKTRSADDWLLNPVGKRLGEPIGCYRNPGLEGEVIGIFADGLAWRHGGHLVELRFADMAEVALPRGKESDELLIKVQDGKQVQLPVKGRRGRFFDSMEMLRFLNRVIRDRQRQASTTD